MDVASFKLKAWYSDVPRYHRPTEPPTHGYRTHLANLLSTLAHSTGSVSDVTVVLDGGKFPPKAAEHARRDSASTSRKESSSLPADVLPLLWKVITPHHFRFTRANLSCIRPA